MVSVLFSAPIENPKLLEGAVFHPRPRVLVVYRTVSVPSKLEITDLFSVRPTKYPVKMILKAYKNYKI